MGKVIWTDPALNDLHDIMEFVSRDSPAYAARLGQRIVAAPRGLEQSPRSGGRVPEFDRDDIREVIVRPYRIIYVIRGEDCYMTDARPNEALKAAARRYRKRFR
jgi:toxin ParE1/3/4